MANTTGKKYGGREKGTPNKITSEIREKFMLLVESNIDRLQEDLNALEPIDRIRMIIGLSKFVLPTLKAIDINEKVDTPQPLEVNFHYTTEELENRVIELIKERDENYD